MRVSRRQHLRERFAFRCGYCGISETDAGALLTTDHFQPVERGGLNILENLVYSCHACNEFKGDWWNPESERRILHPLNDPIAEHLVLRDDGILEGLTPTGIFHIEHLNLNRAPLIAHRLAQHGQRIRAAVEEEAFNRLTRLEQQVERLEAEIERLRTQNE